MGGTRFKYAAFFFGEREGGFFFLPKEEAPLAKNPVPPPRFTPP